MACNSLWPWTPCSEWTSSPWAPRSGVLGKRSSGQQLPAGSLCHAFTALLPRLCCLQELLVSFSPGPWGAFAEGSACPDSKSIGLASLSVMSPPLGAQDFRLLSPRGQGPAELGTVRLWAAAVTPVVSLKPLHGMSWAASPYCHHQLSCAADSATCLLSPFANEL